MDDVRKLLEDMEKDGYIKHSFGKRITKALSKLDATGGVDQITLDAVAKAQEAINTAARRLGVPVKSTGPKLTKQVVSAPVAAADKPQGAKRPRASRS